VTCHDSGQIVVDDLLQGYETHGPVAIARTCPDCRGQEPVYQRPDFPTLDGKGWTLDGGRLRHEDSARKWVFWVYRDGSSAIVDLERDTVRRFSRDEQLRVGFELAARRKA
jgi:hypothetical protein